MMAVAREYRNARRRPLLPGIAGIEQTIAEMRRLSLRDRTDPGIKAIVTRCHAATDIEKIRCLFTWVIRNISYKKDPPTAELVIAPRRIIREIFAGDCDDMSTLLACLLKAVGFQVQFKIIAWRRPEYTHVYLMVFVPSLAAWMPLDPVMRTNGFGSEKGTILKRRHFHV